MQHPSVPAPRLVVAGLSGDSGKTLVSIGLLLLARQSGIPVKAFKKGPDYIDAAWLSWASGSPARNLDTFLMGPAKTAQLFTANTLSGGLNLIEGNRGLFDGVDAHGTHSTAEMAKLLKAPVLLLVNAAKTTHTIAALVLGCLKLDPEVRIGGVVFNHVAGERHESVLRKSLESTCGVPVLGVLPNIDDPGELLPSRHLGLVTPREHRSVEELRAKALSAVQSRLDFDRIFELARSSPRLPGWFENTQTIEDGRGLKIAFMQDSAFTFYYPENLEALERSGAELISVSALSASSLPDALDALYIGGGFPETHAAALSANTSLLASIRDYALKGLPIYAECGGLMLLSESIRWKGMEFPMAGALPFDVEVCDRPQGHGYVELLVDRPNPFYPVGMKIRGHEFHYSKIVSTGSSARTVCAVRRGTGSFEARDAVLVENIWASYTHVHAEATPQWTRGLLSSARSWSLRRSGEQYYRGKLAS
ncbi:MAG: cobyrinate a,c-diamide synthase [Acidobacteria bacterium]|nr:cobyrinate a,c-diamide synthase [Acidobacteriota bacterium]